MDGEAKLWTAIGRRGATISDMAGSHEGFHPPLRHVRASEVDPDTAQTAGMRRYAAISSALTGSQALWMGQTHVGPDQRSGNHHHGDSETAIFVVCGHPEFVFYDSEQGQERRIHTKPGDYVFVPPFTPHREENNDPDQEAVVVIARSTQEAIVVNLPSLQG
ncbi:MAG TPA: cupin domain-containing protein [Jatrophihabitans sp.]|nr:cupin domain-containing protein [Jatrophihabitans sp.]